MKNPGPEDQALIDKESGDRIQESGEIIELMEYWNNGMMVLGAKNFIGSVRLHSRLIALNPLFQHSSIPAFQHSKNKNSSLVIYAFNDYIADKSRVLN